MAPELTLGFLGEDSGEPTRAFTRAGPISDFTPANVLKALGYGHPDEVMAKDSFSFAALQKDDPSFWDSVVEFEQNVNPTGSAEAAEGAKAVFTSENVKELAVVVGSDDKPFSAPAYLVAHMEDGSLLGLRGDVGSMQG